MQHAGSSNGIVKQVVIRHPRPAMMSTIPEKRDTASQVQGELSHQVGSHYLLVVEGNYDENASSKA